MVWRFDFESVGTLGQGEEGEGERRQRVGEFQLHAAFTSHTKGPMVRFRKRDMRGFEGLPCGGETRSGVLPVNVLELDV